MSSPVTNRLCASCSTSVARRDGLVADVVGQSRGRKFFLLRTLAADREDGAEQVKRWLKETPHAKIEGQVRLMGVAR